jgi:hypothetical protein
MCDDFIRMLVLMHLGGGGGRGQPVDLHSTELLNIVFPLLLIDEDRLCGLVVRVIGCRSGGRVRFPARPQEK